MEKYSIKSALEARKPGFFATKNNYPGSVQVDGSKW